MQLQRRNCEEEEDGGNDSGSRLVELDENGGGSSIINACEGGRERDIYVYEKGLCCQRTRFEANTYFSFSVLMSKSRNGPGSISDQVESRLEVSVLDATWTNSIFFSQHLSFGKSRS